MDLHDILVKIKMLEEGIVPFSSYAFVDINTALESLPPEERRKCKRKFRKLWRKASKQADAARRTDSRGFPIFADTFEMCSSSKGRPTRAQRHSRSRAVRMHLTKETIK